MARDRWEYCNVPANGSVRYFEVGGVRTEKKHGFEEAVAELGQQGWELVAASAATVYLKRRIE